jgi:hypothetical protein
LPPFAVHDYHQASLRLDFFMAVTWSTHDTGLLTLELPPGWAVEQPTAGALFLQDPKAELALTLVAASRGAAAPVVRPAAPRQRPSPVEAQFELQKWVNTQNQVQIRQSPRLLAGAAYPTATTEGLQQLRVGQPWYKRLLRRAPLMLWRYWAVINPHLLVLVSCNGKPAAVERHRAVIDRVVQSLHLPDRDILVGRHFTETVVSLARAWFPQTPVTVVDDVHLQFGTQPVSLVHLHRRYLACPDDLPTQVRAFLAAVQGELPASALAAAWSSARDRILPVFLPTAALAAGGEHRRILHEPWVNDLSIAYVLEDEALGQEPLSHAAAPAPSAGAGTQSVGVATPDSAACLHANERMITREDVARWNVSPEDLYEQALHNLVLYSHEHTMQGQKGDGLTLLCLGVGGAIPGVTPGPAAGGGGNAGGGPDRHNAARVLLPELHRKLREHLGPTFFAAMPTRDLLLAFNTTDDDVLERVRQQVADDYARAAHGLSPKLFLVTPDGIAGDPHDEEDFLQ